MKSPLAAIIGLVIVIFASPATAYVVVVTTSIPVTTAADDAQLNDALESAINDVLHHAIPFTPTVVTEIRERMSGNLCRCACYPNIVDAIAEAAGKS